MSVQNPLFLTSLILLAIPILIHLWNLRKASTQYFSNVAILNEIKVLSKRKNKIRNVSLLFLRVLFICLLTVAFAKVIADTIISHRKNELQSILLDVSCSVASEIDNTAMVNELAISTGYEETTSVVSSKTCQNNSESFIKLGNVPSTGDEIVISDFQRAKIESGEINFPTEGILVPLPETKELSNVYVDSVWLKESYFKKGFRNELNIQLGNSGKKERDNVLIELKVENTTIASQMINFAANSFQTLHFYLNAETDKTLNCQVRIDDGSWTFDNTFDFVLTPISNIPIALLSSEIGNNPIKTAYDQEKIFDCILSTESNWQRKSSNVYVIATSQNPSNAMVENILREVRKGGTAAFIFSPFWTEDTYLRLSRELGTTITKISASNGKEIEKPNLESPFMAGIFDRSPTSGQQPTVVPVADLGKNGEAILDFKDGSVALLKRSIDKGTVYLFPFDVNASDGFSRHALFLPIFYRIAERSAQNLLPLYKRKSDRTLEFTPLQEIAATSQLFVLNGPSGEIIPEQKNVNGKSILFLPPSLSLGTWKVMDKNKDLIGAFGYNIDKKESFMDFYSVQDLREKYASNPKLKVITFSEFEKGYLKLKQSATSDRLWSYVVAISFLFLLAETIVTRYSLKSSSKLV